MPNLLKRTIVQIQAAQILFSTIAAIAPTAILFLNRIPIAANKIQHIVYHHRFHIIHRIQAFKLGKSLHFSIVQIGTHTLRMDLEGLTFSILSIHNLLRSRKKIDMILIDDRFKRTSPCTKSGNARGIPMLTVGFVADGNALHGLIIQKTKTVSIVIQ